MQAHIEVIGSYAMGPRVELTNGDLREIGEFTRENVSVWLDKHVNPLTWEGDMWADFHAVCGDIEIPWARKEAKEDWAKCVELAAKREEYELYVSPKGYCERCCQIVPMRIVEQQTGPTASLCMQCGRVTKAG